MEAVNTIGRDVAQAFSGKAFYFNRTKLKAKNFLLDSSYIVMCDVWDKNECEWVGISMTLEQFNKDLPELES